MQMRKRQILTTPPTAPPSQAWLDVERTALVEVTSEENGYPIESALLGAENQGWRAVSPGTQTIRLIFDEPQKLRRIWLVFEDSENTRTQEFVLRWSPDTGNSFREIVRQQWNYSSGIACQSPFSLVRALSFVSLMDENPAHSRRLPLRFLFVLKEGRMNSLSWR